MAPTSASASALTVAQRMTSSLSLPLLLLLLLPLLPPLLLSLSTQALLAPVQRLVALERLAAVHWLLAGLSASLPMGTPSHACMSTCSHPHFVRAWPHSRQHWALRSSLAPPGSHRRLAPRRARVRCGGDRPTATCRGGPPSEHSYDSHEPSPPNLHHRYR